MARLARVVVSQVPHHVTRRGNRRQPVFFCEGDYAAYLALLCESTRAAGVGVWAWCLMPNHVHLMLVPPGPGWRGNLWQGRFASCPMDQAHTLAAARYIELNPVRAGLVAHPQEWRWSSAAAHLGLCDDGVTDVAALGAHVPDWAGFLAGGLEEAALEAIRRGERTGRPLGSPEFIERLEAATGRELVPRKPDPKPKAGRAEPGSSVWNQRRYSVGCGVR